MSIQEPVNQILATHAEVESRAAKAEAEKATLLTTVATLTAERDTLKAALAACEAAGGGGSAPPVVEPVPPPPEPPTTPTGNAPKILNQLFNGPIDWRVFFNDKCEQSDFVVANGAMTARWTASSDLTDMRVQMVMRRDVGGGGTPRRDPIGSERFYAFGIFLPPEFSFERWGNQKCLTGQIHQGNAGGIVSPPFSFEMIKTSAHGEIMRGVLALKGRETKTINIGRPPRTETKIVIHAKWSPGSDGFLKVYRDGVLTPFNHTGPTCNPKTLVVDGQTVQTEELSHSIGSYNPGRKNGEFEVGFKRWVTYTYWKIGNEQNSLGDFA